MNRIFIFFINLFETARFLGDMSDMSLKISFLPPDKDYGRLSNFLQSSSNVMPQTFTPWKAISTPLHKIKNQAREIETLAVHHYAAFGFGSPHRRWLHYLDRRASEDDRLRSSSFQGPAASTVLYWDLRKKHQLYQLYQFKLNLQAFVV